MAIEVDLSNLNPMAVNGIACRTVSTLAELPVAGTANEFCFCDFECPHEETAFALQGGSSFENDKSTFALKRIVEATDTIEIKLFKDDVEIEALNDNDFGEFFDFGGFPTQPDAKVFILDWLLVFSTYSGGKYQVKADMVIAGVSLTFESQLFRLKKFDITIAHKTVRMETVQNGCIDGGENSFDYSGMNLPFMYRIPGTMRGRAPILDKTSYKNSALEFKQIQSTITSNYEFSTFLVPRVIQNLLIWDGMLANEIFFTDYNIFTNHADSKGSQVFYKRIAVDVEDFGDPKYFAKSQKGLFIINFTDRIAKPRKRNAK